MAFMSTASTWASELELELLELEEEELDELELDELLELELEELLELDELVWASMSASASAPV